MDFGFYQCREESFQAHGTMVWFNEGESITYNVKDTLNCKLVFCFDYSMLQMTPYLNPKSNLSFWCWQDYYETYDLEFKFPGSNHLRSLTIRNYFHQFKLTPNILIVWWIRKKIKVKVKHQCYRESQKLAHKLSKLGISDGKLKTTHTHLFNNNMF
jgi:hypothetical protein